MQGFVINISTLAELNVKIRNINDKDPSARKSFKLNLGKVGCDIKIINTLKY